MKRYGYLYDKICTYKNVKKAHYNARKKKSYYEEVKMVNKDIHHYIKEVQTLLINKTYKVSPYKIRMINDKGKERKIAKLPYYPDRIVHWAILQVIEPLFIKRFIAQTYSAIPKRGTDKALHDTRKAAIDGLYVIKVDVRKYYNNIDKEMLKQKLRTLFKDKDLLNILDIIVDSFPEGIPIGNYTSQYFANFFLCDLDHKVKETFHTNYYRYMDDITIIDTKENCKTIHRFIKEYAENNNLSLHKYELKPVKNQLVDFVGYRFTENHIKLRPKIQRSLQQATNVYKHKKNKGHLTQHNISRYYSLKGKTKNL